MTIKNFSASGFRNLEITWQELSQDVNIIHGDNAQGKTNFLEAVYFCAFGRSLRARTDSELITWGKDTAQIRLETERGGIKSQIDAQLESAGKKTLKSISSDFLPIKHMKDLFGRLLVVMFTPEDLRLIKAGPAERRRFMDMEICQLSPVYYADLREYFRTLKQRNALLKQIQRERTGKDSLEIWDAQLVKYGLKIIKTRTSFIQKISETAAEIHKNIAPQEELRLEYKPGIVPEVFAKALARSHERDIMRGTTGDGIHTDDAEFTINGVSARHFGSQGQQRTAALSAKLAEIEIIKQATGETPILLLDDVLSELDTHRQKFLLQQICDLQAIVTCTGVEDFPKQKYATFKMHEGKVEITHER